MNLHWFKLPDARLFLKSNAMINLKIRLQIDNIYINEIRIIMLLNYYVLDLLKVNGPSKVVFSCLIFIY